MKTFFVTLEQIKTVEVEIEALDYADAYNRARDMDTEPYFVHSEGDVEVVSVEAHEVGERHEHE